MHVERVEVGGGVHTTRYGIQLVGEVLHVLDVRRTETLWAKQSGNAILPQVVMLFEIGDRVLAPDEGGCGSRCGRLEQRQSTHGRTVRPRRLTAKTERRAVWKASGLRASKRIIMTAGGDWERNGARRRRPWIFFAATGSASGRANQGAYGPEIATCSKRLQAPTVFRPLNCRQPHSHTSTSVI
jgi:hypothetical protein